MKKFNATLHLHLWLDGEHGMLMGMGRCMLLQQIDECGSLKKAATALGMSYRAAWGKLKATEETLGAELIEKHGTNRQGYQLTPYGRELMCSYAEWFHRVERFAADTAEQSLGWKVGLYEEKQNRNRKRAVSEPEK